MPQCSAWNCSNRSDRIRPRGKVAIPGKTYHKFPKNAERRNVWVTALQREDFEPSNYSVLCADHFEESCFDRTGQTTRLRENAIPTIFDFSPIQKKLGSRKSALNEKASPQDLSAPPDSGTSETVADTTTLTTCSENRGKRKRNPPAITKNPLHQVKHEDQSAAPDLQATATPAITSDSNSQAAVPVQQNFPEVHSEGLSVPSATQNSLLQVKLEDNSAMSDSLTTVEPTVCSGSASEAPQVGTHAVDISSHSVVIQQKSLAHNEHAYTVVSRKEKKRRHDSTAGAVRRKIRKKLKPGATRISSVQLQQLQNQLASSSSTRPVDSTTSGEQCALVQQNSLGVVIGQTALVSVVDQSTTASSTFDGASGQSVLDKQNSSDDQSSSASSSPMHIAALGSAISTTQSMIVHQKSHVRNEHAYTVVSPREMKRQLDLAIDTIERQKKKLKLSQRRCRDLQKQVDSLRQKVWELQKN